MATFAEPGTNLIAFPDGGALLGSPLDGGAPIRLEDLFDGPHLDLGEEAPAPTLIFADGEVDLTAFDTQPVPGPASQ